MLDCWNKCRLIYVSSAVKLNEQRRRDLENLKWLVKTCHAGRTSPTSFHTNRNCCAATSLDDELRSNYVFKNTFLCSNRKFQYTVGMHLNLKVMDESSFSKLSVTSPTSQLILQPFPRFTYFTAHSPTLPLLRLRHSSFSSPSFASTTSQDFHLSHLASRPCRKVHIPMRCFGWYQGHPESK